MGKAEPTPEQPGPELADAQLLDELVAAIQAEDSARREELLQRHPHLQEWVNCLKSLDSFAPKPAAAQFAETMISNHPPAPGSNGSSLVVTGQFGKYELLGEVGRGGMGVVYKARQRDLKRIVALKMILASEWASAEEISRFQAEARAVARLRHRNIVGIFEVGEELGRHFFAMDFVEGKSLAELIATRPLASDQAARWMVSIAQAVDHLHAQGLIHRDLKPSNILIDGDNEPMVTDFGLAKMFEGDGAATRTGAILGTPSYMSPEQASGRNSMITVRSDVYSLGAMLYEMLSGRPPFREDNPLDTLVQVLEGEPTMLRQLVVSIPRELELICFKCLEKDPERRYASAAELAADLTRFLRGDAVEAQAGGVYQVLERWVRRQPGLACRLAVLLPVIAIIQIYFMTSGAVEISYHLRVVSLLALWAGLSVVWQMLLNRESLADASRIGTILTDTGILTALFAQMNNNNGTLVVVYALLIVASGLWFQEQLVWSTTVIVEVAFGILLMCKPDLCSPWHYPLLVGIALAAVGASTSFQVHRVRALSRFYDRRPL
ncbi:MAG: serine/threonine protein kinase [Planctomycetes bacterium]|nr:serine/threonine protein kinase [Planctomycetota bacterium]